MFGLKFREGRRPKVKFSVKRGHGRAKRLEEVMGLGDDGKDVEGERGQRAGKGEARARKRKREHGS